MSLLSSLSRALPPQPGPAEGPGPSSSSGQVALAWPLRPVVSTQPVSCVLSTLQGSGDWMPLLSLDWGELASWDLALSRLYRVWRRAAGGAGLELVRPCFLCPGLSSSPHPQEAESVVPPGALLPGESWSLVSRGCLAAEPWFLQRVSAGGSLIDSGGLSPPPPALKCG